MSEERTPQSAGERIPTASGAEGGPPGGDDPRWLDRPGNVNRIVWALVAVCATSVLADLFHHKHGEYDFQTFFGFDAGYGFVSCVGLVLLARVLRRLLMRSESYYD